MYCFGWMVEKETESRWIFRRGKKEEERWKKVSILQHFPERERERAMKVFRQQIVFSLTISNLSMTYAARPIEWLSK